MRKEDLIEGVIVTGPPFQEPVRVFSCVEKGSILHLAAIGMHSGKWHSTTLKEGDIARLSAPARPHKPLVRDGKLTIPLYHGTSSLFVDSILQTGLGGRNLIKELRVVDLLGKLARLCKEELEVSDDEDLLLAERIINQEVTQAGLNFRHGSVYLSPADFTAITYAAEKNYGSEAIQCAMNIYREIQEARPTLLNDLQLELAPLLEFVQRQKKPILIKVRDVPVEILKTETGQDPEAHLADLEETLNLRDGEIAVAQSHQQTNFEAIQPISPSLLTLYQVVSDGSNKYSLLPYSE